MTKWGKVDTATRCGLCGGMIEPGMPALFIELAGLKRPKVRGQCCAGPAVPALPARVEPLNGRTKAMKPLAQFGQAFMRQRKNRGAA